MLARLCGWIIASVFLGASIPSGAKPVAEEFTVPLQTKSAPINSAPRGVRDNRSRTIQDELIQGQAIRAATASAAIAAVVKPPTAGCRLIRFNSGFGWVATGAAQYPPADNPVSLRRARQEARFKAFIDAQTRLSHCLAVLPRQAKQRLTEQLVQHQSIRLALVNLAFTESEQQEQALRILARSFVAHSIEEVDSQRTFYVHLVTTPNTARRLTRPAPNAVETVSLEEGLRQTEAEISAGLIPPVGNRLIVTTATGELALVGYAINLIGEHPDPVAQTKLRADAEKIATTRATEALSGLALGDDAVWLSGLDDASRTEAQMFHNGYASNEPSIVRFVQLLEFNMAPYKEDLGLAALREGRSAAISHKRFGSLEGMVATALIYIPQRTKQTSKTAPVTSTNAGNSDKNKLPAAQVGGAQ